MTRINSAIPAKNLIDSHLRAELRELPRIFTAVNKRINQGKGLDDIPEKFTLGEGHCKFFYDKCKFLIDRHTQLRYEYQMRFGKQYDIDPNRYQVDFKEDEQLHIPTQEEWYLLITRISTRIIESKQIPRYYGKPITKQEAVNLLVFGSLEIPSSIQGKHNQFTVLSDETRINSALVNEYLKS